ncbi:MAG: glycine cleavage system protein GcvH [Deltaproteobacteria bacterium]|nr:glycine cleavage system protein GcvH [Deltaproteobacteria bacterium]
MSSKELYYPDDLKYNIEHTWLKVEGNKGRVGITDFAQDQLTDILYVELPEVGTQVEHMQPFGVVESAKSTNDLFSPVSGAVIQVNGVLSKKPGTINKNPYSEGWIVVIGMSNPEELDSLISADQYKDCVEKEG